MVYSILKNFQPLYRGFEHRSFICQIKFDNFHMRKQIEMMKKQKSEQVFAEHDIDFSAEETMEESKQESTAQKIRLARRISKVAKLSEVLRKNSSIERGETGSSDREYRLITAGEDGNIFWWSFRHSYSDDLSAIDFDLSNPMNLFLQVNPSSVPTLQSMHQIHLTENSQIYALILGPNALTICQNDGILTFYKVLYEEIKDEEDEEEKDPLIDQENEESKKKPPKSGQARVGHGN